VTPVHPPGYTQTDGVWTYLDGTPVPHAVTVPLADGRLALYAPELHPDALWDTRMVAEHVGVQRRSVAAMVTRGSMPEPQYRFNEGQAPMWSGEIIRRWKAAR
jgi:hypothetical protein